MKVPRIEKSYWNGIAHQGTMAQLKGINYRREVWVWEGQRLGTQTLHLTTHTPTNQETKQPSNQQPEQAKTVYWPGERR